MSLPDDPLPDDTALGAPLAVMVLCAGIGDGKRCEADPAGTRAVNAVGSLRLVEAAMARGAFVVVLSTSQVLRGDTPFATTDAPVAPQSEYGRQRAELESALHGSTDVAILRLSKVLGVGTAQWAASSALGAMARQLAAGEPVHAFYDLTVSPLSAPHVARVVTELARRRLGGLHHCSATDELTYADAARMLAAELNVSPQLVMATSGRERVSQWYGSLDSGRLSALTGVQDPESADALRGLVGR